jgi:predicted RNA-binding Zn-ribbon protein involved in translation (DUF1610 family)
MTAEQSMPPQSVTSQSMSSPSMSLKQAMSRFDCPNCGARYALVRVEADGVEADGVEADGELACRSCGGPLQGYDGPFILKYFLVERPRHARRQRSA